ncbi:MAG: CDP-alcohol phosphatidyltransferase family protein [Calditrichia bacterium]
MDVQNIFEKGKVWTLSNFLSAIRIVLGFLLYCLVLQHSTALAILTGLVAIITDFGDGYFARKRNEISELGKILDPIGDKVTVILGSIGLYQTYGMPLVIVIIIIARDVLILLGSIVLMTKFQQVIASRMPGKIAVTIIALLLLAYLLEIHPAQKPLIILAIIAIFISFTYYMLRFFRLLREKLSEGEMYNGPK